MLKLSLGRVIALGAMTASLAALAAVPGLAQQEATHNKMTGHHATGKMAGHHMAGKMANRTTHRPMHGTAMHGKMVHGKMGGKMATHHTVHTHNKGVAKGKM